MNWEQIIRVSKSNNEMLFTQLFTECASEQLVDNAFDPINPGSFADPTIRLFTIKTVKKRRGEQLPLDTLRKNVATKKPSCADG